MLISNREFREYLLSIYENPSIKKRVIDVGPALKWDLVWGQWDIKFVDGWGMKNNAGLVTIQRYEDEDGVSKIYSLTMKDSYYDFICQEFRQSKIDKILC